MKSPRTQSPSAGGRPKARGSRKQGRQVPVDDAARATDTEGAKPGWSVRVWAAGLLVLLLVAYLANGTILPGNDAVPNVRLPLQVLQHKSVFFTPGENPSMFEFQLKTGQKSEFAHFRTWGSQHEGQTVWSLYLAGRLTLSSAKYYLSPTIHTGKYASTFGLGAGMVALPVYAVARLLVSSLEQRITLIWHLGKIVAAVLVTGSALFLFFAAAARVPLLAAFLLALAYGLGTCVWSTSSQALWQHGPCELFMAMGAYYLLRKERRYADALSGLGFGLAVFCRPTIILVVLSVLLFHAWSDRRRLLRFVLGGLPVALVVLAYGQYTFGNPFTFGQLANGAIAQGKTGNPSLWQTPLYLGASGLLFSPARGLLVYSPIALFALWGMGRAFRDAAWKDLRPLALGAVALFVLSSKWFDWWGGWCFGYRPIVDTATLLAFLALPIVERVRRTRYLRASFAVLLSWSVAVQIIGAFAYDVGGWNTGVVYEVTTPGSEARVTFDDKEAAIRRARERGGQVVQRGRDIDARENRHRLWSITDSPIPYYVGHFSLARQARGKFIERFLNDDG
jgi:hypothetical protein